jgi:hypothetical protein
MRERNEDIHVFILEEDRRRNRERALREQALRDKFQEPSQELVKVLQRSSAVLEELVDKEIAPSDEVNQSTTVESESDVGAVEHVDVGNSWMKPVEVESSGPGIDRRAVAISTAVYACSLIAALAVLWVNVVATRDFYSLGLQFSPEWATPYRMAIGTALGMLGLTAVAELFQIYVLVRRKKEKGTVREWKAYVLPDGSAIRVKTVVREVKRLGEHGRDGKPIYAVKADNLVDVLEFSEAA